MDAVGRTRLLAVLSEGSSVVVVGEEYASGATGQELLEGLAGSDVVLADLVEVLLGRKTAASRIEVVEVAGQLPRRLRLELDEGAILSLSLDDPRRLESGAAFELPDLARLRRLPTSEIRGLLTRLGGES